MGRRHAARCVELVGFVVRAVRSIWRDSDVGVQAARRLGQANDAMPRLLHKKMRARHVNA